MTRIKFSALAGMVCLFLSACAGGNAIEEGVPAAALGVSEPAVFPPPASPTDPFAQPSPTVSAPSASGPSPITVVSQPTATAPPANALVTGVPANSGTFPNSGIERPGATSQLTNAERDRKIAELQALRNQQQSNTVSASANQARLLELQNLARTHSQDTIKTIEAQ